MANFDRGRGLWFGVEVETLSGSAYQFIDGTRPTGDVAVFRPVLGISGMDARELMESCQRLDDLQYVSPETWPHGISDVTEPE